MGMDSDDVSQELNKLHNLMADEEEKIKRYKIEVFEQINSKLF